MRSLHPDRVRFTYDRPTDTLFTDLFGEARPAASDPVELGDRDFVFLRLDVETGDVVGLQIEGFLSYAVDQHPELVDALPEAEVVGLEPEEATRLRQHLPPESSDHPNRAELIDRMVRPAA